MNRDNKHAPLDDDDDFEGESHAADEPTAVWDENALRAAGLTDLLKRRPSDPPAAPATPSVAVDDDDPSIVVDQSAVGQGAAAAQGAALPGTARAQVVPATSRSGMGWAATLGLALALGALVYFLIRFIKG